jgi:DNA-binding transcriptional ArsR family regulator
VEAAARGASALERFIARSVAEYYAIRDAAWSDARDEVLGTRVRDYHNSEGFHPTGRVGTLHALLRPSVGTSPCRVLYKVAMDESASDLRAVTIDAKIQSLWEAIENVLLAAFAKAQNDPSDDLADERFCKAWDALRDYVPRPKKEGPVSGDVEASRLAGIGQVGRRENEEPSQAHSDKPATTFDRANLKSAVRHPTPIEHYMPFTGGQMEFFPDRVSLCGAVICRNGRPKRMREVLDSLRQTGVDGDFISYSGSALAERIGVRSEQVARVTRDIRGQICEALRQRKIECGSFDVILSRSPGYLLSQKLTVKEIGGGVASPKCVRSGRGNGRVSGTVTGLVSGTVSERRMKILQILADGRQIRLPAIASQIGKSERTVRRDLDSLRAAGKIEFIGSPRTGYYRLCPSTCDQ